MEEERITGNTQWDGLGRPAIFYGLGRPAIFYAMI